MYNITHLDLPPPEDCIDNGIPRSAILLKCLRKYHLRRCQDYILIDRGAAGVTEICGNLSTAFDSIFSLDFGSLRVVFRSGEASEGFTGFSMVLYCINPQCDFRGKNT